MSLIVSTIRSLPFVFAAKVFTRVICERPPMNLWLARCTLVMASLRIWQRTHCLS
jgi:hypothetical protein